MRGGYAMQFEYYLLMTKRLTKSDYDILVNAQARIMDIKTIRSEFIDSNLPTGYDFADIGQIPAGEILRKPDWMKRVQQRTKRDVRGLIKEWFEWHRRKMEPICTYTLEERFGKQLYQEQVEKKLVGLHVADMVADGENVVIPEGSSAFYVGLALGAKKKNISIITSDGALMREYLDNPALAARFRNFLVIGGDEHVIHGGVFGRSANAQYIEAIGGDPGATVVVMPVNGLLAKEGPYAWDGDARSLKESILAASSGRVLKIVFIADYSKHLRSKAQQGEYRAPMYTQAAWHKLVNDNRGIISIVTTPPPRLRNAILQCQRFDIRRRAPSDMKPYLPPDEDFTWEETYYHREAKELEELTRSGTQSMFFEALEFPPSDSEENPENWDL